jgi:hypothetical protein
LVFDPIDKNEENTAILAGTKTVPEVIGDVGVLFEPSNDSEYGPVPVFRLELGAIGSYMLSIRRCFRIFVSFGARK